MDSPVIILSRTLFSKSTFHILIDFFSSICLVVFSFGQVGKGDFTLSLSQNRIPPCGTGCDKSPIIRLLLYKVKHLYIP
ncbi:MAG: hypothetical protein ACI9AT_002106, partial [Ulvibacter sp.]